jgi:hypothetical protein
MRERMKTGSNLLPPSMETTKQNSEGDHRRIEPTAKTRGHTGEWRKKKLGAPNTQNQKETEYAETRLDTARRKKLVVRKLGIRSIRQLISACVQTNLAHR